MSCVRGIFSDRKTLITDYGNRVLFAFRNFPLYTIHPDAGVSAQAADGGRAAGQILEIARSALLKTDDWVIPIRARSREILQWLRAVARP